MATTKTKPQPQKTRSKEEDLHLECQFTEDELKHMSSNMARKIKDLNTAELHKKDVVASINADIQKLETEIQVLATKVNDGFEFRMVPCITTLNFEAGTATTTRQDTGAIVSERMMTDDEAQMGFI